MPAVVENRQPSEGRQFVAGRKCAPVSVGIPTWARGVRIFKTIEQLAACDPPPAEVIVHVDSSAGEIEAALARNCPTVQVLSSGKRVGPGGGRHRCISAAREAIFASFDDDSWPVDRDYFRMVLEQFEQNPRAAIVQASIYQQGEAEPVRSAQTEPMVDYIGCGYALRVDAYRATSGHIDRYCPYGLEEFDLALQLYSLGWEIVRTRDLRVFHDTHLVHHTRPDVVAGVIGNIALRAFLRYPAALWPRALAQLANAVFWMLRTGRVDGIRQGLIGIPATLREYSGQRRPLPAEKVRAYLNACRSIDRRDAANA